MHSHRFPALWGAVIIALCLALALTACGQPAGGGSSAVSAVPAGDVDEGIGETAAKAVALAHAQLTEDEVSDLRVTREQQNGTLNYLVDFSRGGTEYRYTVDAASGSLLSSRKETAPASSAAPAGELDEAAAKAAALAHAQLTESDVTGLRAERDYDHGRLEYDVEFWQDATEYDYTIDGTTGKVLEYQRELHRSAPQSSAPAGIAPAADGDIGADAAAGLAVAHAQTMDGLIANQVSGLRTEQDYDDGRLEYEVEFWWGSTEYDYTIDGADGTVLKYHKETHSADPAAGDIGEAAARAAALAHARLTESDVTGLKVERDYDHGRLEYEVKFWQDATEYDYTIDGADGTVLKHHTEVHGTADPAAGDIGEAAAKAAALAHARLTESDVTGLKVERDYDKGRLKYGVEFRQGATEYDYTIDGADGTVLKSKQNHH